MPSGQGVISDDLIYKIAKTVRPIVETFLLTSETYSGGVVNNHRKVKIATIQMVDNLNSAPIETSEKNFLILNWFRSFTFFMNDP